jgi:hypothetical protein
MLWRQPRAQGRRGPKRPHSRCLVTVDCDFGHGPASPWRLVGHVRFARRLGNRRGEGLDRHHRVEQRQILIEKRVTYQPFSNSSDSLLSPKSCSECLGIIQVRQTLSFHFEPDKKRPHNICRRDSVLSTRTPGRPRITSREGDVANSKARYVPPGFPGPGSMRRLGKRHLSGSET